ncbi:hypothetical protein Q1695_011839 [Nippostrongylus brasiliensis]|nr:hypothetical protein Q1695_011839 [Nippostrongylus brasiliensis]
MKEDDGGGYENLVDGTKTKEEEEVNAKCWRLCFSYLVTFQKKKADDKAKTKNKDSVEKDDDGAYENLVSCFTRYTTIVNLPLQLLL